MAEENLKSKDLPRVMIVGTGSSCGKTTVTCGLLTAFKKRSIKVAGFKCGPDYIDPMFHSEVIGAKSRNLDLFLCGEVAVRYLLKENSVNMDFSLIEGVMGMYDGISSSDQFSSNHLALVTDTPEILIVNTKGKSLSLVAELSGYVKFRKNNLKGVIFNNTKSSMYNFYKDLVEETLNLKVYGYLPHVEEATLESRHLGLITAEEVEGLKDKLDILAEQMEKTVDIEGILKLGQNSTALKYEEIKIMPIIEVERSKIKIAVAKDKAFCFYYEDNLSLLEKLGAELVYFSPLKDKQLPKGINGIILGGGYPEEYGKELSENIDLKNQIKIAYENEVPIYAECGGFMYLCESLKDNNGHEFKMTGLVKAFAYMKNSLERFGYITLTAQVENLLCKKSDKINAHEFHYSDSSYNGDKFTAEKITGKSWSCIHADENFFVGYPHLHFWGNISFAENYIKKCAERKGLF